MNASRLQFNRLFQLIIAALVLVLLAPVILPVFQEAIIGIRITGAIPPGGTATGKVTQERDTLIIWIDVKGQAQTGGGYPTPPDPGKCKTFNRAKDLTVQALLDLLAGGTTHISIFPGNYSFTTIQVNMTRNGKEVIFAYRMTRSRYITGRLPYDEFVTMIQSVAARGNAMIPGRMRYMIHRLQSVRYWGDLRYHSSQDEVANNVTNWDGRCP